MAPNPEMSASTPLSTLLSQVLVAFTIEFDNEFERRFAEAGGGARVVSVVMWSNFLRFVRDGITVGELPTAAGLQKARMLSTLGGMERWRYVVVEPEPEPAARPPTAKRDGWGSAQGLRSSWVVRPTPAGRKAAAIWQGLFDDIEGRWEERFGTDEIDELRSSLRTIVGQIDVELPEYMPIVGGANGMAADLPPLETREAAVAEDGSGSGLHLSTLLSRALLAYTLDFERESELSLPLSANFVRVLDEKGVSVRDLPLRSGVSREATAMALTFLARTAHVAVEGASAATKLARLTPKGRELKNGFRRLQADVEEQWGTRFGADGIRRLRSSLERLLDERDGTQVRLARGLHPHPGGWRKSKRYVEHTEAMIDDPIAVLPHYPMVLHRGGWPDGS